MDSLPEGFQLDQDTTPTQTSVAPNNALPQAQNDALPQGFQLDSEAPTDVSGAVKAGLEGLGRGVLGPLATAAESHILHVPKAEMLKRQEEHPIASTIGEVGGLGAGMLTGTGEAALMEGAGKLGAEAVGLGRPVTYLAKVGSSAVKQAVEMAVLQSSDETSKMLMNDPNTSAETALSNIGLASALGAGTGAFVTGALSPLWKATVGNKLGGVLEGLKMKLNGESISDVMNEAKDLGLQLKPEVAAMMSEDPFTKNIASKLSQTDTSMAGRGYQESLADFRKQASDSILTETGKTPETLGNLEVSKYDSGKDWANTLASKYEEQIAPSIKAMEESKLRLKDEPLIPDQVTRTTDYSNPYNTKIAENKIPGTTSNLSGSVNQQAMSEGWLSDRNSDTARMIKTATKDIANAKTLGDLIKTSENIGKNTKSTLPFGQQTPLSRAGAIIKDMIEDHANQFTIDNAGSRGLTEEVQKLLKAKQDFKGVAQIKNALDDRLKTGSSVSGFGKALREMGTTDGESVYNRLNGAKDVNLLQTIQEHYPEVADKIRQAHLDKLVKSSMKGEDFDSTKFIKNTFSKDNVSPELRNFIFDPQKQDRLQRLNELSSKLNNTNHNFSNTARTIDKMTHGHTGGALGYAAALSGHLGGALIAPLASFGIREGSDAARLSMLRFLASEEPIKAEGFKAMASMIQNTIKGGTVLNKAAVNVLKPGAQVAVMPHLRLVANREKLDKQVDKFTASPESLMSKTQGETGHYLPQHQVALTQATTQQIQYLSQLKPRPVQPSPLDKPIMPSMAQKAVYNKALDIANDPTIILQHVKDGTLQIQDMKHLAALYPNVMKSMAQRLSNEMGTVRTNDTVIPYHTRMGLSVFLGQALDSSMHPQNIQAAQVSLMPQQSQNPQPQSKQKGSPSKIGNKTNAMYKTPIQSAEGDRSDRD